MRTATTKKGDTQARLLANDIRNTTERRDFINILFMGTPAFAVPCLEQILACGHSICAVITQPDKPKGRGHKLSAPPVKECAIAHEIAVHQPPTLKDGAIASILDEHKPDMIVVVAYGKILPKYVLDHPKCGCINIHASLLPKYRGAAPINWCIINGETVTGITSMYMAQGLDTGDMIVTERVQIESHDTAGSLHDTLAQVGARVLAKTIEQIEMGTAVRIPQDHQNFTYAQMIDKKTALIDWSSGARGIQNLVRGLNPSPAAYTYYAGRMMKIFTAVECECTQAGDASPQGVARCTLSQQGSEAQQHEGVCTHVTFHIGDATLGDVVVDIPTGALAGQILTCTQNGMYVLCGDRSLLCIKEVQFEGKKRMQVAEYIKGNKIENILLGN